MSLPDERRKTSFAPVVSPETRVLILGSLPGDLSLAQHRYYAHPRNMFWHFAGRIIAEDLPALPYDARLERLRAHRIGLWDVVAAGTRKGSLDSAIRDAAIHPLGNFCEGLPELRAIGFNGKTAAKLGRSLVDCSRYACLDLPSSSPAYAAMPVAEKEKLWLDLREYLETHATRAH
ncbi:DNA-deoxyinosine glycosylase [Aurantiacibacter atlanticus]|uniref:DNA-deoxyinosine glycosylase n=1 Tax=Aurantiacibacter atlanticus TaxID=1648404 RepID=UPI00268880EA